MAIICVPTIMSYSPAANALNLLSNAFFAAVVSASMRSIRALGNISDISSSMRCVPVPFIVRNFPPQDGQTAVSVWLYPQ